VADIRRTGSDLVEIEARAIRNGYGQNYGQWPNEFGPALGYLRASAPSIAVVGLK